MPRNIARTDSLSLTGDNEAAALLEERMELKLRIAEGKTRLKAIDETLTSKLGEAQVGLLPGWTIWRVVAEHRAYTVPEGIWRYLRVKQTMHNRASSGKRLLTAVVGFWFLGFS
jgi:hypothetical protein